MQERIESGLMKSYIEHQALERFVLSLIHMHSIIHISFVPPYRILLLSLSHYTKTNRQNMLKLQEDFELHKEPNE